MEVFDSCISVIYISIVVLLVYCMIPVHSDSSCSVIK